METFAKKCVAASLETLHEDPTVRVCDKQTVWKLLSKIFTTTPLSYAIHASSICLHSAASYRMRPYTSIFFNDASHKRERVSYVCVYNFKVLPHDQKFSS